MAAPLSTFMTQLLDDSISKQSSSNYGSNNNLYEDSAAFSNNAEAKQEQADTTDSSSGEDNGVQDEAEDQEVVTSSDLSGNIPVGAKTASEDSPISPTGVADDIVNSQPETPRQQPKQQPGPAAAAATTVPDKKPLRKYRQSIRDDSAAAVAASSSLHATFVQQEEQQQEQQGINSSAHGAEASLTLDQLKGGLQSNVHNSSSGSCNNINSSNGNNASSGTYSSSSLTMFMTQLLNDSDIDKLIREGDHSTETTSTDDKANNSDNKDGKDDNDRGQQQQQQRQDQFPAECEAVSKLSQGAANVLASAVHALKPTTTAKSHHYKKGEHQQQKLHTSTTSAATSSSLRESYNAHGNSNGLLRSHSSDQNAGNDADIEGSYSTLGSQNNINNSSSGSLNNRHARNARQPTRRKRKELQSQALKPQQKTAEQQQQQQQNQNEGSVSISGSEILDFSLEAAKECLESMAQIDALIRKQGRDSDPASLAHHQQVLEHHVKADKPPKRPLVRRNSDSSLMSSNAKHAHENKIHKKKNTSMLGANNNGYLHDSNSTQSMSMSGLRQALKKSASLTHLRQQMTRLQSREHIYSGAMDLDYEGDNEINKDSNRFDYSGETSGDGSIEYDDDTRDTDIEKELDREIEANERAQKNLRASEEKQRRARSSTPRKHRASSTTKRRSTSVSHGISKSKRTASADPSTPRTPRTPRSSSTRRRTPSSRRTASAEPTGDRTPRSGSTKKRSSRRTSSEEPLSPGKAHRSPSSTKRRASSSRRPSSVDPISPRTPRSPNSPSSTKKRISSSRRASSAEPISPSHHSPNSPSASKKRASSSRRTSSVDPSSSRSPSPGSSKKRGSSTRRSSSSDPSSPRSPSPGSNQVRTSSTQRRGRTPNSRKRTSSAAAKKGGSSSSIQRKERSASIRSPKKSRSKSASHNHDRSSSATPAEQTEASTTGKVPGRRRSTASKMKDGSSKRDASTSRQRNRSIDDKESMRDHSKGRSRRTSRALGSSDDLNDADGTPATPRIKSPNSRPKRSSTRIADTSETDTQESLVSPRTPRGLRTPRTPSNSTTKVQRKSNRTAIRSKSNLGVETGADGDSKFKLKRTKTIDSVPGGASAPAFTRRNSMTGATQSKDRPTSPKSKGLDSSEVSAGSRRAKALDSTPSTPVTPRKRHSMVEALTATLRRKRERANSKDASRSTSRNVPRRAGVSVGNPPRRQESDPVPLLRKTTIVAEEAAKAAKEMERCRNRSARPGLVRSTGQSNSNESGDHSQRTSSRRGFRQRSNLQAQQSLRHALNEEIKAKEEVRVVQNPLLKQPKEGGKEATWISRRKNRLFRSQQS